MRWLELFAGGGGAALGIRAAGGESLACVELDEDACATLDAAGFPVVRADLRTWSPSPGLSSQCSALWSSFPCQAFSVAGKRLGSEDPRNGWPWTRRILDVVRPSWFVAENVRGITMHSREDCGDPSLCAGCYFHRVILEDLTLRFRSVEWRVLDAAAYGVPQRRRRLVVVAGPHRIRWPEPTHASKGQELGLFALLPSEVSMGDALGVSAPGRVRKPDTLDGAWFGSQPQRLLSPSLPVLARCGKGRQGGFHRGRDAADAADAAFLAGIPPLTSAQCATLQGFPAGHSFTGGRKQVFRQIGNAVPPRLAEVIARAVHSAGASHV